MFLGQPLIRGDHIFTEDDSFDGIVGGSVTVAEGVELTLTGMVGRDLVIRPGAVVHLAALVGGHVRNEGGQILTAH